MRAIKNLTGAVLISIAILLVWVVILPSYDEKSYLESAIQRRSVDFEVKSKLISRVEDLDKEYQSRYTELKRLSMVVPEAKRVEEMITIIEDMFSSTGIPLKDIVLSAQDDKADSPYNMVSMEFNLKTTNDSIINFLISLERSIRLIDTTDLAISVSKEGAVPGGSVMLDAVIKARAYFLSKNFKVETKTQQPIAPVE